MRQQHAPGRKHAPGENRTLELKSAVKNPVGNLMRFRRDVFPLDACVATGFSLGSSIKKEFASDLLPRGWVSGLRFMKAKAIKGRKRFVGQAKGARWLLTPREQQVLDLLAEGLLYKEIADRLGVSRHTVNNHLYSIRQKLGAHTAIEAINRAYGRAESAPET